MKHTGALHRNCSRQSAHIEMPVVLATASDIRPLLQRKNAVAAASVGLPSASASCGVVAPGQLGCQRRQLAGQHDVGDAEHGPVDGRVAGGVQHALAPRAGGHDQRGLERRQQGQGGEVGAVGQRQRGARGHQRQRHLRGGQGHRGEQQPQEGPGRIESSRGRGPDQVQQAGGRGARDEQAGDDRQGAERRPAGCLGALSSAPECESARNCVVHG